MKVEEQEGKQPLNEGYMRQSAYSVIQLSSI